MKKKLLILMLILAIGLSFIIPEMTLYLLFKLGLTTILLAGLIIVLKLMQFTLKIILGDFQKIILLTKRLKARLM